MRNRVRSVLLLSVLLFFGSVGSSAQSFEKMDETWTVMVNGQSVRVEADGSFTIPNVSAPDQFGPGGPGTAPDFVSDDFVRVIGVSTDGGTTRYAYSDRFRFRRGQPFSVGMMTIQDSPPPFPQSIFAQADSPVLTTLGEETQIRVTGRLIDGSPMDVTVDQGTTYRTSNQAILDVDGNGMARAVGAGVALITAGNEGATAVVQVIVAPGDLLTEVVGLVQMEDGSRAAGATVVVIGQGLMTQTQANGAFSIPMVATQFGEIRVSATLPGLRGTSDLVEPMPGLLTDVGTVTLVPVRDVLVFGDYNPSGEQNLLASDLTSFGRVVVNSPTLPADLSTFGTIWHVGAFVALTTAERNRLAAFVSNGGGLHLTGERPCCEALNGSIQALLRGLLVENSIIVGGQGDVLGPYLFNPAALAGITADPNQLTQWSPSAPGGAGGLGLLPDPNILVTGSGERPVGGVWDCFDILGGRGRITLFMDVNWLTGSGRFQVVQNLQTFLEGGCSAVGVRGTTMSTPVSRIRPGR